LTHYDRIIFLDVDVLVIKPLDELFHLPPVPIAAPIAYWLDPPKFTSAFLVIQPQRTLFDALVAKIDETMNNNGFDMDLLNDFFRHDLKSNERYVFPEIIVLPGYFLTLSPHLGKEKVKWNGAKRQHPALSPFLDTDLLHNSTYVVHFSGGPKPWSLSQSSSSQMAQKLNYYQKYNLEFLNEFREISKSRGQK